MRPCKLEIEGINSFSTKAVIDFSLLVKSGLFGIFGNTGSGKSTILDSITLALYGRTHKTREYGAFVNIRMNNARVAFTFDIAYDGAGRRFEVVREFNVNRLKKTSDSTAVLYEYRENERYAIEENASAVNKKIIEIIGFNIDDFQHCIALPQGEFASFVTASRGERLEIIERLFSLDKYTRLAKRASSRALEIENVSSGIRGQLKHLENCSNESLAAQEAAQKELIAALSLAQEENVKIKNQCVILEKNRDKYEAYAEAKRGIEKLTQIVAENENNKKKVSLYLMINDLVSDTENLTSELEKEKTYKQRQTEIGRDYTFTNKKIEELSDVSNSAVLSNKLDEISLKLEENEKNRFIKANYDELIDKGKIFALAIKVNNEKCNEIKDKIKAITSDITALENDLSGSELSENAEMLVNSGKLSAYNEELVFLAQKNRELDVNYSKYSEDKLYPDVKCAIESRSNILNEAVSLLSNIEISNKNTENSKISAAVYKEKTDALSKLKVASATLEADSNIINKSLNDDSIEIERLRVSTKECMANASVNLSSFDADKFRETLLAERERITVQIQKNNDELEKEKNKLSSLALEVAVIAQKIEQSHNLVENLQKRIDSLCTSCGIIKRSDIYALHISKDEYSKLKKETENYDLSLAAYKRQIVENEKIALNFDIELLEKSTLLLAESDERLNDYRSRIAVAESRIEDEKANLLIKNNLTDSLKEENDKLDAVNSLYELVKFRRLTEFIGEEYLKDIADRSSSYMLSLSNGRYSVMYEGGEFYVLDNMSGGKKRSASTLSGGETFILSLSLAISLSSEIYYKSARHIEFFFLDEGFGSLDDSLIDTVLDSLDKLKNSHFTIGLISHVAELKNRIQAKILVDGATPYKGSSIEVVT